MVKYLGKLDIIRVFNIKLLEISLESNVFNFESRQTPTPECLLDNSRANLHIWSLHAMATVCYVSLTGRQSVDMSETERKDVIGDYVPQLLPRDHATWRERYACGTGGIAATVQLWFPFVQACGFVWFYLFSCLQQCTNSQFTLKRDWALRDAFLVLNC